nr:DUF763 domain-containing protein [Parabacteroides goldsteinii]
MKRGTADLPLHYGTVPPWLAERMSLLGGAIAEAIIIEYGRPALLQRLSDPFWFQSLGCAGDGLAFVWYYNVCYERPEKSDQLPFGRTWRVYLRRKR